jgi:ribosomal-protein-alanine N-acetyltransferase
MSATPPQPPPVEAGVAHADALAAIHAAAFRAAEAWSAAVLATQLSRPGCFALIDPVGGMVLARVAADEAEILTLAVAPAARRGGIGRRLVAAAMRRAAAAGAAAMFLEVAPGNAPARALYARAGFVRVGRRAHYYPNGGDALVLRAELTPRAAATTG